MSSALPLMLGMKTPHIPEIKIQKVAIIGGVHGNELTGIYLIDKLQKYPKQFKKSNFEIISFLGNPKAIEIGQRYFDIDLNRCFTKEDLQNSTLNGYEHLRAKELFQTLNREEIDLIIDLHSTTSDMGITLILNEPNPFLLKLATYVSQINLSVKVLHYDHINNPPFLRHLCPLGLTIEVGAVPHNQLNLALLKQTEKVLHAILFYINAYNKKNLIPQSYTLSLYRQVAQLDYPRDKQGRIVAKINPYLRNYQPIEVDQPIFINNNVKNSFHNPSVTHYPVFIGESAYIEKGIAMGLTVKEQIKVIEN